ncbi:MAG TPA: glycoside hydrolase family 3 C-terminal domain-containing protein [Pyrinomonadaceae bacterium]|nr:glycoside hydrolase family 3 C-terminal domain-containing protein [Pyrinomonadaceae bacterium]
MKNHCRVAACVLFLLICQSSILPQSRAELPPYKNPALPIEKRVEDLVSRMTLEEKVSQMLNKAAAIERLDIPAYDWWNEALHGVARAGTATVFPQAIGLAATWDTDLMHRVADVISTEARAKYNDFARKGERGRYKGLTFWSPNINIFRDPRWGRGQETYGEDPYLTSLLGVAFVRGLQGDHPRYLKVVSTPKHYAVHSGPEPERHSFDAVASERDMRETYLPAFRATVVEGRAEGVMCAYNRTNGEPACANKQLFEILRREWAFKGHVVSDCGAIEDIYKGHRFVKTEAEASAVAVKAGTDLTCGGEYKSLVKAVKDGIITEAEIDVALKRLMRTRFRLGMFDPPEMVPFSRIPLSENDSPAHRRLALTAARESIVLLKNANKTLPLAKDLKTIAVIGPNADAPAVLLGNYNGTPSSSTTPLQGIRDKVSPETRVVYALGSTLTGEESTSGPGREKLIEESVAAARASDAVVMVLGIAPTLEGEEMKVEVKGFRGGDRTDLSLPEAQENLLKAVQATGKPVVLVLMSGSALAVNWADENVPAIVQAWYPGEEGGAAIADVLFGDYNPAGRLPVTFYKSADDLPPFEAYGMQGRTYRYFKGQPLYPFGHGLSYTRFVYGDLKTSARTIRAGASVRVSVDVRNAGERAGDEVVQLYVTDVVASVPVPIRSLQGISRVSLRPGERRRVSFTLAPSQMSVIDDQGRRVVEPGEFLISVGGKQPGFVGTADSRSTDTITRRLVVTGKPTVVP